MFQAFGIFLTIVFLIIMSVFWWPYYMVFGGIALVLFVVVAIAFLIFLPFYIIFAFIKWVCGLIVGIFR